MVKKWGQLGGTYVITECMEEAPSLGCYTCTCGGLHCNLNIYEDTNELHKMSATSDLSPVAS